MSAIESKIKDILQTKGIKCHSVYKIPDPESMRVLLAFNSQKNPRLTTRKIKRILNETGTIKFKVPTEFLRLSASFLHLEITFGARMETEVTPNAQ